ncbi:uncharacterized protein LOC128246428 [Mya arenaria]|uniref:uncharacterized protein LOC128246428 n=1 Tax=Mya arenaria TaxID=6604 RepID=UPI0022E87BF7|nr:uncharacterized protein LOC128246428 [Mya arenaria]
MCVRNRSIKRRLSLVHKLDRNKTLVYKVNRDKEIFKKALKLAMSLYGADKPKRPTKLSDEQKALKQEITTVCKDIPVIGRFASCKAGTISPSEHATHEVTTEGVDVLLNDMHTLNKSLYQLKREKASEAVVFLVADLDRSWETENIRAGPVAWFPKGYSLTVETMRRIAECVHTECHRQGIHIPCESFDGQWHNIVTRTTENKPLTIHQLQRDVWQAVEKLSKKDIVSKIKEVNKVPHWNSESICDDNTMLPRNILIATNCGKRLPKLPKNLPKPVTEENDATGDTGKAITLADVMPDPVQNTCDLNSNVLSMTTVAEHLEMEAYSGNINETGWAMELNDDNNENGQIATMEGDVHQTENDENTQLLNSDETNHTGTHTSNKEDSIHKSLELKDLECILSLLRTTGNCCKNGKWDNIRAEDMMHYFESKQQLVSLLDSELRVVLKYLKKVGILKSLKESVPKGVKVREISKVLNISGELPQQLTKRKSSKTYNVKSLTEMATKEIAKFKKEHLNVIEAEYEWPEAYNEWQMSMVDVTVDGIEYEWFYHPEYSIERQQYEVRCIDSTHLLTRARRKSCYGGLDGLSNEAWLKVAKSKKTLLTPIMITEVTDPMSAAMSKTHFSSHVEAEMRSNGDIESADLCHDIRCWWEAEDKPGISAQDRVRFRQHLRNRLLSRKNFYEFPPATNYARGWPIQLWEGILASIDAKCLLYAMTKTGTYNQRAFSSMIGETFFSEVSLHDKRGQGTLTSTEFGMHIGNTIEQMQTRLDPDRSFSYCTSKKAVYEMVDKADKEHYHTDVDESYPGQTIPSNIITRNHHFDSAQRARVCGSKKVGTISTERNALHKGALGVRWEKARCNQSKLLPTSKMGIE